MKDFNKLFEEAVEKKDLKMIQLLLEEYKKENSLRINNWQKISKNSLLSFTGYFFLKKHGLILYGKIVPELLFVLLAIDKILDQTYKNLNKISSNSLKKNLSDLEILEGKFEKLSLKFQVYYQLMSGAVGAYNFYKKNLSITYHFLEKLENQFQLQKIESLSILELKATVNRLEEISGEYLKKAINIK